MGLFEMDYLWLFFLILPIIAFMYSAVGHGGASGYLAMMALFGFAPETMKPTALLLNLFVAAISLIHYYRAGHFNWKLFITFALASIPLAFIGGMLDVEASLYKKILSVLLIFAVLRILDVFGKESVEIKEVKIWQGLTLGGLIGFFSGLIGIGGGIILSPIILLLKWGKMKEAAAVSALFIWVNSAAGMAGQISTGVWLDSQAYVLVGIVVVGGFFGSYLGSKKFNNRGLKYMLAIVLIIASVKLFVT